MFQAIQKLTEFIILQTRISQMLILSPLARQIQNTKVLKCFEIKKTKDNKLSFDTMFNKKPSIMFGSKILWHNVFHGFSKQRIMYQLQKFNQQLDAKRSSMINNDNIKEKENPYLQKQQKIIKDFMDLTEESFSEQLEQQLKEKYHVDAQMLLMIVSSLQDPKVIKQTMTKIYPFIPILQKKQILLLLQLIVAHRPQTLPPLSSIPSKPLQGIQSIILLLSQVYPKEQKITQWLKEIPLYKGKNVCMLAAGFFAVYQKMQPHVRFKNQRVINRCIERIVDLAADQNPQTQVSIAIMGLESEETGHFADKLLIELDKIDYSQVDPLKLQLFFIHLQRSISSRYAQASMQSSRKSKYKILSESQEGQVISKQQQEYQLPSGHELQYAQISQIQKFKFLNSIAKNIVSKIIDMNWNQLIKLNLLIEYWRNLHTFPNAYPWNSFKTKLVHFTNEKPIIKKMTNLKNQELLVVLQAMQKLKISKSQLLMRLLTLISDRLGELNGDQLMRLTRVCVTFVRQCEDFLISVRFQIQNRKFIFSNHQIDQLNEIFKRVLILFPRPLVK